MSEIKVGDRFELTGTVIMAGGMGASQYIVQIGADISSRVWVDASTILAGKRLEPALKVGDKVRFKDPTSQGSWARTILAVDGEEAWIKYSAGKHCGRETVPLSDLERVP